MTNPSPPAPTPTPRPGPSDAELRATYARESPHRPQWPKTYEAAIADPLTAGILRLLVVSNRTVSYGRRAAPAKPSAGRFEPSLLRPAARMPPMMDQKRLASGEKPEPDDN